MHLYRFRIEPPSDPINALVSTVWLSKDPVSTQRDIIHILRIISPQAGDAIKVTSLPISSAGTRRSSGRRAAGGQSWAKLIKRVYGVEKGGGAGQVPIVRGALRAAVTSSTYRNSWLSLVRLRPMCFECQPCQTPFQQPTPEFSIPNDRSALPNTETHASGNPAELLHKFEFENLFFESVIVIIRERH